MTETQDINDLLAKNFNKQFFEYGSRYYAYFDHPYNDTRDNERSVEVPIALNAIKMIKPSAILEIGNVLSHYAKVCHDIVDKYEVAPGVMNKDVAELTPDKCYDLIISVSTFEHVGFDEQSPEGSAAKIRRSIEVCRGLLTVGGRMLMTVPVGYNPDMDKLIWEGLPTTRDTYFKRTERHKWEKCWKEDAMIRRYNEPFPCANGLLVAWFGPVLDAPGQS